MLIWLIPAGALSMSREHGGDRQPEAIGAPVRTAHAD
jgi:hypothetical protein